MSNELAKFSFEITSLEQAMQYAKLISDSDLAPKDYKGKPGNTLIAIQMGIEVGLQPMQAIQNIAVINGKPCLYGDAAIGVVRVSKQCELITEWLEGSTKDRTAVAYCKVKRKGQSDELRSFSVTQAITAGLWGKAGPWTQYPERMLQMRARGFALRDVFPDLLRGLSIAEEIIDYPADRHDDYRVTQISNADELNAELAQVTPVLEQNVSLPLDDYIDKLRKAPTIDEMKLIYVDAYKALQHDAVQLDKLNKAKDDCKSMFDFVNEPA